MNVSEAKATTNTRVTGSIPGQSGGSFGYNSLPWSANLDSAAPPYPSPAPYSSLKPPLSTSHLSPAHPPTPLTDVHQLTAPSAATH